MYGYTITLLSACAAGTLASGEAAEVIRAEVGAISAGEVATYRAALLASGYTPFGSGL